MKEGNTGGYIYRSKEGRTEEWKEGTDGRKNGRKEGEGRKVKEGRHTNELRREILEVIYIYIYICIYIGGRKGG